MRIEDISRGQILSGVETDLLVTVVIPEPISEGNITLVYRLPDGSVKTRFVDQAAAESFQVAQKEIPWKFDGNGESFKLAAEAQRIDLAFLFDPMMAVHTANVEPLPHQITAVYECMLPQQPLRFVLADDPGAGKTIMAGLYIRELHMRADAHRVLIVAPGSLVDQWRDELYEKFGMEFKVYWLMKVNEEALFRDRTEDFRLLFPQKCAFPRLGRCVMAQTFAAGDQFQEFQEKTGSLS